MITHNFSQGSKEWLAHRKSFFNASDAPSMMGASPHKTRNDLLHEIYTGLTQEVDSQTQRRFDDGHRFEALARPLAEEIIGEDLYPVVGSEGKLSASFDGLTIDNSINFEHKTLNAALAGKMIEGCTGADLDLMYQVQMEQQHFVSGAEKTLFMASKWDGEGNLIEERYCWYVTNFELRRRIIDGWAQFEKDLAAYVPPVAAEPKAVGVSPESLPALRIEVQGMVTASNLAEFKSTAVSVINSISTELETDQDFANAEKTIKWCEEVQSRLEAAKEHALSQTQSIDELFKTIDAIAELTRDKRLILNKLVKERKEQIRTDIVMSARLRFKKEIDSLNDSLGDDYMQLTYPDFAGAIKGKKTVESIQNAVDTLLAQALQDAHASMNLLDRNLAYLDTNASDHNHLFPDLRSIIGKASDDFEALVQMRLSKFKQDQEAAKAKEQEVEPDHQAPPFVNQSTTTVVNEDDGARMKLGEINTRISPLSITADGLAQLGFVHVATDKSAKLYRASDFGAICAAIVQHINALSVDARGGGMSAPNNKRALYVMRKRKAWRLRAMNAAIEFATYPAGGRDRDKVAAELEKSIRKVGEWYRGDFALRAVNSIQRRAVAKLRESMQ